MSDVFEFIDAQESLVIDLQSGLTSHPALSPDSGGDGEMEKFTWLKQFLSGWNFTSIDDFFAPDPRVSSGKRPSMIATIKGKSDSPTLWLCTHLDVVPPGDKNLWDNDPFKATVKDGKIYGRGTEDNQQSLVSSLVAAKAMLETGTTPEYTTRLLIVADEEVGSEYGIQWLMKNHDLFKMDDLILVPDGGHPEGKEIEIAEKSIIWMTFIVSGKQSHGSRPDHGINAASAASHLVVRMEGLRVKFNESNPLYDYPTSSFEPTKRTGSVQNINTIPATEEISFDCRILPQYNLDDVIKEVERIKESVEQDYNVTIELGTTMKLQAPEPTPVEAPVVKSIQKSVKKVLGVDAVPIGIGGGTVAAYLRKEGYQAALWSTIDSTMHAPNENSTISNTLGDAKVFADMMMGSPG
jgi:succinyl-diaminopimelate desuccinylase